MGGCEGGREAPCTFNLFEAVDFVDCLNYSACAALASSTGPFSFSQPCHLR